MRRLAGSVEAYFELAEDIRGSGDILLISDVIYTTDHLPRISNVVPAGTMMSYYGLEPNHFFYTVNVASGNVYFHDDEVNTGDDGEPDHWDFFLKEKYADEDTLKKQALIHILE